MGRRDEPIQVPRKLMGALLVENRIITETQLQEILELQKQSGERLGRILVNRGYLTESQINEILELQLGISRVSLCTYPLVEEILRLVPEALIRRHKVIPLGRINNKLRLAMVDPLNLLAIDDVRLATGLAVEPFMTTEEEVDQIIREYFGLSETVEMAYREIAAGQGVGVDIFDLDRMEGEVAEAPIVRVVNSLFQGAIKDRASDIHIEIHEGRLRIRYRLDGMLRDVINLPKQIHGSLISRIKIMADMDIAEKRIPQDGRIQIRLGHRTVDLRVSSLPTVFGEKIVIRILDKGHLHYNLEQLGFNPEALEKYRELIRNAYGLVLVTGPTGSGKTTTLYATLHEVNDPEKNIITLEDPVEYIIDGINQVQINPKAGLHFAGGLRSILRQDPDLVLVGEIRDGETAEIAVRAASTGHLVMSTLHTNDAAGAVNRLLDMGVEPFRLASSLIGVVGQRLVRLICPECKMIYQLPKEAPERLYLGVLPDEPVTLYRGKGCSFCHHTGYKGRMAIQEVLVVGNHQRELILKRGAANTLRQSAIAAGMKTMRQDGIEKALKGLTTMQEVMRVAYTSDFSVG